MVSTHSILDYLISVMKLERIGDCAIGCFDVAVFYFNGRKGVIEGQPLAIYMTRGNLRDKTATFYLHISN